MQFNYKLLKKLETIGSLQFEIERIQNLNEAIDEMFDHLEKTGKGSELETLCPYFGTLWPSARALSLFLAQLPEKSLSQAKLLELGCGLALPSLVAARRGASVTATDSHPDVELFLNKNTAFNSLENQVSFRFSHWAQESPFTDSEKFHWVIASDVLYERSFPKLLAKTMTKRILPGGKILLADPGRPYLQAFVDAMTELGFLNQLHPWQVSEEGSSKDIFILEFWPSNEKSV